MLSDVSKKGVCKPIFNNMKKVKVQKSHNLSKSKITTQEIGTTKMTSNILFETDIKERKEVSKINIENNSKLQERKLTKINHKNRYYMTKSLRSLNILKTLTT